MKISPQARACAAILFPETIKQGLRPDWAEYQIQKLIDPKPSKWDRFWDWLFYRSRIDRMEHQITCLNRELGWAEKSDVRYQKLYFNAAQRLICREEQVLELHRALSIAQRELNRRNIPRLP